MSHLHRVLVGTTKGAFILESDDRQIWTIRGPFCDGWPINHVAADPSLGMIWAAGGGEWQGAGVFTSRDDGTTWHLTKLANGQFDQWLTEDPKMAEQFGMEPSPPAPFTDKISAIWSLHFNHGTLYAGAKPATLFKSLDQGKTWAIVEGLTNHPSSGKWQPGGAGLTLHTIVTTPEDPEKLWVGISAAGVFASENGGETWDRRNRLDNASVCDDHTHDFVEGGGHETGHCVHNIQRADCKDGDLLYQQNHHGVFRSSDGGQNWHDITAGLPSNFGFPIGVHPHDPQTIWVLPLNGDSQGRFPPDASAAIWKSTDGGETWAKKQSGLPTENCYFTVLRQAMATDKETDAGVYFGTNSGSIFASTDAGENWSEIARHLPTVLCVETM